MSETTSPHVTHTAAQDAALTRLDEDAWFFAHLVHAMHVAGYAVVTDEHFGRFNGLYPIAGSRWAIARDRALEKGLLDGDSTAYHTPDPHGGAS